MVDEGPQISLDNYQGPLNEWIALESTRQEIRKQFRQFLTEYRGMDGQKQMSHTEKRAITGLLATCSHLLAFGPRLCFFRRTRARRNLSRSHGSDGS